LLRGQFGWGIARPTWNRSCRCADTEQFFAEAGPSAKSCRTRGSNSVCWEDEQNGAEVRVVAVTLGEGRAVRVRVKIGRPGR
jgi:hypothetical protein